jgi:predicted nuclease of predicted toxin-antitoxin system
VKRFFLDANVLWSAASKPEHLPWKLLASGRGEFLTSFYAVAEARRNLPPRLHGSLKALTAQLELVADAFGPPPAGVRLPAKDIPIFSTAAMARADCLVTGDSDFSQYFGRTVQGVKVILPRMIEDELKHPSGQ